MASIFQKEREDRELFSEFIETLVNPFLFHVQPPPINDLDLNFYVQICWETLWVWRGLTCDKVRLFSSFKDSLKILGYDVKDESKTRVVPVLITRIHWMLRQTAKIKNSKRRRLTREENGVRSPSRRMKSASRLVASSPGGKSEKRMWKKSRSYDRSSMTKPLTFMRRWQGQD